MKTRLGIFFFSLLFSLCLMQGSSASGAALPAPDFSLIDLSGKKVALSQFKGNVVLLNFWATWCWPCRAEMPALNKLFLDLRGKGFVVLAVATDSSIKPVQTFAKEKNLAFPILHDKEHKVAVDKYHVIGLPTTFLIDKNGLITEKILGEREWNSPQIKEKILKLLRQK